MNKMNNNIKLILGLIGLYFVLVGFGFIMAIKPNSSFELTHLNVLVLFPIFVMTVGMFIAFGIGYCYKKEWIG